MKKAILQKEQKEEVKRCHKTRNRLAEWSKTPEGRESYEKVAEEMRKQIIPKDLEEAVEKQIDEALFKWSYDDEDGIEQYVEDAFIAGAKWDREQMLKDAVEGEVMLNPYPTICLDDCKDYDFKDGDKVRVIIVKED